MHTPYYNGFHFFEEFENNVTDKHVHDHEESILGCIPIHYFRPSYHIFQPCASFNPLSTVNCLLGLPSGEGIVNQVYR